RGGRLKRTASLADGRYQLNVKGDKVHDFGGGARAGDGDGTAGGDYVSPPDTAAAGPGQLRLCRLYGAATGDGFVDSLDLQALRPAFNTTQGIDAGYLAFLDG